MARGPVITHRDSAALICIVRMLPGQYCFLIRITLLAVQGDLPVNLGLNSGTCTRLGFGSTKVTTRSSCRACTKQALKLYRLSEQKLGEVWRFGACQKALWPTGGACTLNPRKSSALRCAQ